MAPGPRTAPKIAQIVELRSAARAVTDPSVRARLRWVELELRGELGWSVPKTQAAAALSVSVTALERWIARGRLPVVSHGGTLRSRVAAAPFLDLVEEAARLRNEGRRRGILAEALARLDARAQAYRPNQPAAELRAGYLQTSPEDRLDETANLSRILTSIASSTAAAER